MTSRTHPALIQYPAKAAFGRPLPKSKLYEHGKLNTRLKNLFVQEVDQIVWRYKLAPETVNLPASVGVPEIQVFSIQLKTPDLSHDVLRCIDEAVQYPIIFELVFEGRTKVIAAYKRPNEADSSRWVVSDYFASEWLHENTLRIAMPVALNLGGLYVQVLQSLISLPARPQEALADHVSRVSLVAIKQREVTQAANKLVKEKQFNRKVEVNALLRRLKMELEQLIGRQGA